jgi:AraC-like DNA-binding protein
MLFLLFFTGYCIFGKTIFLKQSAASSIFYDCEREITRSAESFIANHSICYIQSGMLEFELAGQIIRFCEGEAFFVRRHLLARSVKHPAVDNEYKSLWVHLSQEMLRDISTIRNLTAGPDADQNTAFSNLNTEGLLKNYFESLPAYQDAEAADFLIKLKIEEGIFLLLNRHPELKDVLFNFSPPDKADLEVFMNANFRYNIEMQYFAALTGRSLAAFKRDFNKTFNMSPNRWLVKRRLEEARFLIKKKRKKVLDVYREVGFEDLSHFSYAFKKAYGIAPSYL